MLNKSIPLLREKNKTLETMTYRDAEGAKIMRNILFRTDFWGMSVCIFNTKLFFTWVQSHKVDFVLSDFRMQIPWSIASSSHVDGRKRCKDKSSRRKPEGLLLIAFSSLTIIAAHQFAPLPTI